MRIFLFAAPVIALATAIAFGFWAHFHVIPNLERNDKSI